LSVADAAWTAELNVETLATIPLHVHSTNMTGALDAGERLVCALRTALCNLCTYYQTVATLPPRQIEYPFRSHFLDKSGSSKSFKYLGQVEDKRIFRGLLQDGSETPVYIKFSRRYGEAAHYAAARAGLAPQLYSVEMVYGWYIVVMEDLSTEYDTLSHVDRNRLSSLQPAVENAVRGLHELGHVHGDIRGLNILIRKPEVSSERPLIVFVDWDWSGTIGEVCYPHNMNPALALNRPMSAVVSAKIEPAHDLDMVSRCFDLNHASSAM
jgi:hypothetical protein